MKTQTIPCLHRISVDEYRVCRFKGQEEQQNIALSVDGLTGSVTVHNTFLTDTPGNTVKQKLENEIYQHTDIRGKGEQLLYLVGSMLGVFGSIWT